MSDDLQLPADLAAIEAKLALTALPPSPIDRDDLFYRAGWAAHAARTSRIVTTAQGDASVRTRRLASHALTAAVAASLAVVAAWVADGRRERSWDAAPHASSAVAGGSGDRATVVREARPQGEEGAVAGGGERGGDRRLLDRRFDALLAAWDRGDQTLVAGPWIVAGAADGDAFAGPPREVRASDEQQPRAATARELMEEFLPRRAKGSPS